MDRNLENYPKDARELVEEALVLAGSAEHCLKGWHDEEHNKDGCCCCNCVYQKPINGHPWNRALPVKTRITQIVGYGCNPPDLHPFITFFESSHGMCEMYARRKFVSDTN